MALTITLAAGTVTLEIDADLTSLNEYDRRFVMEMLSLLLTRAPLSPQAAEPIVLDSLDAAEAAVSNVIRWLDSHKLIYGGLGDELETEKLIEDAKIGIGLIRYEVAAEPPERG